MLYTYTSFANSYLDMGALSDYDLWLADYRGYMGIQGASIWQYSSFGAVDGIAGRVDMNIAYKDYPALIGGTQKGGKGRHDGVLRGVRRQELPVLHRAGCERGGTPATTGGTLKSGSFYPVMADAGAGADGYHWYRVYAGGATRYAVLLDDRSRITALSAGGRGEGGWRRRPGAVGGDAAALEQQVEQLTARAADAEKKAAEARAAGGRRGARCRGGRAAGRRVSRPDHGGPDRAGGLMEGAGMEWTAFETLAAIAALFLSIGVPVIRLNSSITKLTVMLERVERDVESKPPADRRPEEAARASHEKLWRHSEEQDERLNDHETRIQFLEKARGED